MLDQVMDERDIERAWATSLEDEVVRERGRENIEHACVESLQVERTHYGCP